LRAAETPAQGTSAIQATVAAPPRAAKSPAPEGASKGGSASFSAKGLHNEQVLSWFYAGDFESIKFDREDVPFQLIFGQYLQAYARHCDSSLPANKVEMTEDACVRELVRTSRYGPTTRTCTEYRKKGTGLYADPALYQAMTVAQKIAKVDVFRSAFRMAQQGAVDSSLKLGSDMLAMVSDMKGLFQLNACDSPGLMRFQENLGLFALAKQPLRLTNDGGTPSAAIRPADGTPFQDQNYQKLLEDLIREQAKTWVMNRFTRVTRVEVESRDQQGRPSKLVAGYDFMGFNGRSDGSVSLTFSDGLPECMYFWDVPKVCRTPNRKIVTDYAKGGYGR
jgi:hypothetical protein